MDIEKSTYLQVLLLEYMKRGDLLTVVMTAPYVDVSSAIEVYMKEHHSDIGIDTPIIEYCETLTYLYSVTSQTKFYQVTGEMVASNTRALEKIETTLSALIAQSEAKADAEVPRFLEHSVIYGMIVSGRINDNPHGWDVLYSADGNLCVVSFLGWDGKELETNLPHRNLCFYRKIEGIWSFSQLMIIDIEPNSPRIVMALSDDEAFLTVTIFNDHNLINNFTVLKSTYNTWSIVELDDVSLSDLPVTSPLTETNTEIK